MRVLRARGLSGKELAHAVAIALYQPNYCLAAGFWEEGAKTLTASLPVDQGIRAVDLARAGLSGPLDLLEHPLGFFSTFSFGHFEGLFDGLGERWFSDTLCFKRFPGTSYVSAPVEGALNRFGKPVGTQWTEEERAEMQEQFDARGKRGEKKAGGGGGAGSGEKRQDASDGKWYLPPPLYNTIRLLSPNRSCRPLQIIHIS